jgi:hypothetical protein
VSILSLVVAMVMDHQVVDLYGVTFDGWRMILMMMMVLMVMVLVQTPGIGARCPLTVRPWPTWARRASRACTARILSPCTST